MLYLIGLGLDLKDISLRALEAIKKSEKAYLETYTTTFPYKIQDLEKLLCKKVILSKREVFENDLNTLLSQAKREDIAILIYGDPLAATTHITIIREAEKAKVPIEIIHNNSIFNVVSDTGLQLYKFGKTTSLPRWQKNYKPTSFFEIIKENISIKAHTLILVDPGMNLKDALKQIDELDITHLLTNKEIIIFSKGGLKDQKILKGKIKLLISKKIDEPFSIIVPGELHFSEKD
jgi:diphthine synthase